jgi:SAM-dependent methyltransferase
MLIGGQLGYRVLRWLSPQGSGPNHCTGEAYARRGKLETLLGPNVWSEIRGKVVVDFGCGSGREAIEIARHGAHRVIGLDIRNNVLEEARGLAEEAGFHNTCTFCSETSVKADVIISVDAFEHFENPRKVLAVMDTLLKPEGCILVAFGPTWYHPLGGHLFSVFPWAHLVFTERALIRWRSDFKTDGATRFSEVEGGLNQMSIRRFEQIVAESVFKFKTFEAIPIRTIRRFHNSLTREFLTAVVRCKLVKKCTPLLSASIPKQPQ